MKLMSSFISFDSRMAADATSFLNMASSSDCHIRILSLWAALNCCLGTGILRLMLFLLSFFLLLIGVLFNTGSSTFSSRLSLDELTSSIKPTFPSVSKYSS